MSLWFADLTDTEETESNNGCYFGIFKESPAAIGARLPRPAAPFVPRPQCTARIPALSCIAAVVSGLPSSNLGLKFPGPMPWAEV
jgi:hypothetical protein